MRGRSWGGNYEVNLRVFGFRLCGFFSLALTLIHELIEFGFILGFAQTLQELFKALLLVFQATDHFIAIAVKGRVAS